MLMQRRKRGANAIEFALTLPVFLAVFMGSMDWGWYFFLRAQTMNATMIGCEAGARVHPHVCQVEFHNLSIELLRQAAIRHQTHQS